MNAESAPGTPAMAALSVAGVDYTVRTYVHDPAVTAFGAEAAQALDVAPERVFKTLMVAVDGTLTAAVVPVSGSLNLKALAAACGRKKAVLADPRTAERRTGYVLGGISPVGQRRPCPVVLDSSALRFPTVLVSGGRRGLELELAPADLAHVTGARTAPIASAAV